MDFDAAALARPKAEIGWDIAEEIVAASSARRRCSNISGSRTAIASH